MLALPAILELGVTTDGKALHELEGQDTNEIPILT